MVQVRVATDGDTHEVARLLAQLGYPSGRDEVVRRVHCFQTAHRDAVLVAIGGPMSWDCAASRRSRCSQKAAPLHA